MRTRAAAAALIFAAALTAEAGDAERFSLVRKLDGHEVIVVQEDLRTRYVYSSLRAKSNSSELSWVAEYKDRPPLQAKGLRRRSYSLAESRHSYEDENGEVSELEDRGPSLADKTIAVSTPEIGTKEYLALSAEQKRARAFDSLIDLLLPKDRVKKGQRWKLKPQAFSEFFFSSRSLGLLIQAGRFRGTCDARLDEVAEQGGRRIAVVAIRLKGHFSSKFLYTKTKTACAITGRLRWDLTGDLPVELKLEVEAAGRTLGRETLYKNNNQPYPGQAVREDRRVRSTLYCRTRLLRDDAAAAKHKEEKDE